MLHNNEWMNRNKAFQSQVILGYVIYNDHEVTVIIEAVIIETNTAVPTAPAIVLIVFNIAVPCPIKLTGNLFIAAVCGGIITIEIPMHLIKYKIAINVAEESKCSEPNI